MSGGRVLVEMKSLVLGGIEVNAVQFAAKVRDYGFESTLIAPSDSNPTGPSIHEVAAEYGVEVQEYERQPTAMAGARMLSRMADEARADIVHVYGQRRMRAAYLGPCRFGRRPIVVTAYEMEINPFNLSGSQLIVGTKYLEEEQAGHAGGVTLISPPVDIARDAEGAVDRKGFRRAHGIDDDAILAVWVGRLASDMKLPAVRSILAAAERLDRRDLVFLIVGDGDAAALLSSEAADVNARLGRSAVVFTGSLADPRPAYASADIVIGMGSSAGRGLSFGRPLVAVGEGGWSQRFDDKSAAAIFRNSFWSDTNVADPGGLLADELMPLLPNAALREQLGSFGRQFAEEHFGLPRMAEQLASVYQSALTTYGPRMWARDLDLEVAAATHKFTRRFSPTADAGAEYEFSERFAARRRARAQRGSRDVLTPSDSSHAVEMET